MKRRVILLSIIICMLMSGCGVYTDYRDLENLLIVQTIGIDYLSGGVSLSFATAGTEDAPLRLSSSGNSINAALENARNLSTQGELFFSHTGGIVTGRESAETSLRPLSEFICRSPQIRTDVDIFISDSGEGSALILDAGDDNSGISEVISKLQTAADNRHSPHIYSAAEMINRSERYGSSLVMLLKATNAAESDTQTAAFDGYAIIDDYVYIDKLRADLVPTFSILENMSYISDVRLPSAVIQLERGKAEYVPLYENGELTGIRVNVKAWASVLEAEGDYDADKIRAELEQRILRETISILTLSRDNKSDFLALAGKIGADNLRELLPELRFTVAVSCNISHSNDIKE